jgi:hypothetical protein
VICHQQNVANMTAITKCHLESDILKKKKNFAILKQKRHMSINKITSYFLDK